ncbi:ubiquitin-like small modifier protein 1 [Corallococcus silvisoli]|uniref:ubiquitin-like small modifier protein 1 n=1 Tax=Corallococcus silvisoli TaxID=2697031 RepID=UPI0013769F61|nr:ubiquitin-like small modifier protein 1 [Corallococcus silvisoli]NBD12952.1 molybdopterin synthase sulfur carrier subunit [Corallococcus silvisoli]
MATVRIPTTLRGYTQNHSDVSAQGATVGEVLRDLEKHYPGIGARLLDEKGSVRRYVNVFHNDEDIRFLQALATPVKETDRLTIVPAIAGG